MTTQLLLLLLLLRLLMLLWMMIQKLRWSGCCRSGAIQKKSIGVRAVEVFRAAHA